MSPDAVIGAGALWIAIPLALLAGLVSFLSPCILPLVPGYLGFIGGAAGASAGSAQRPAAPTGSRRRMLLGVLLFIAGFTVVFVAYTVVGGAASVFFLEWGDLITRILGGVVVLMLWFYISSLAILAGAEMNAEIEHASPHGKDPGEKVPGEKKKLGARAKRAWQEKRQRAGAAKEGPRSSGALNDQVARPIGLR